MSSNVSTSWVSVGNVSDLELAGQLASRVEARRAAGEFTPDNQRYIELLSRDVIKGGSRISARHSELLRRLCGLHQVTMQLHQVTSHRKYTGPIIVALKKILYRVVKPLMDPMLQQQREFNATAVYLLADLANEAGAAQGDT
jgi:hypothetical protein